jgi:L-methionine (R)-S-oxide reductase
MWAVTPESLQMTLAAIARSSAPRAERAARACLAIHEATGERWVGIYSVLSDQVVIEAWVGPAAPAHPSFPVSQGLTSRAIATARSVVSNDVTNDVRYLPNQSDSRSELIVPVVVVDQVIGTLDVESDRFEAFDVQLTTRFEMLALAIRALWA